jgi:hypothetical protein
MMVPPGSLTAVELMQALGHVYGFEIKEDAGPDRREPRPEGGERNRGRTFVCRKDESDAQRDKAGSRTSVATAKAPPCGDPGPGPTKQARPAKKKKTCINGCNAPTYMRDGRCYRCMTRDLKAENGDMRGRATE